MGRPIIFCSMDNAPKFCDNRCNNTSCKKHISKLAGYYGGAVQCCYPVLMITERGSRYKILLPEKEANSEK